MNDNSPGPGFLPGVPEELEVYAYLLIDRADCQIF